MNANAKGPVVKLPDAPSSLTFPSTQPLSNCPQAAPVMLFARLPIRGGREILLTAPLASFFFFLKNLFFTIPLPLLCSWAGYRRDEGQGIPEEDGELNSQAAERGITVGG